MSQESLPWILIVTHGDFGKALIDSTEMICGKLNHVKSIGLMPGEAPEELAAKLKQELEQMEGDVILLVDLFGGTPSNICSLFAKQGYKVLSGVSMPMLMAADMARETQDWDTVLDNAADMTKEGIVNITERVS